MIPILSGNVASAIGGGYEVANSCRFNDDDSAAMSKSSTTLTNDKKFTISAWVKRSTLGGSSQFPIFGHVSDSSNSNKNCQFGFFNDALYMAYVDGGSVTMNKVTTALYRDIGAWYHVMVAVDSTQGTAANRNRFYVNGTEVTSFSTDTNVGSDETFLATSCTITVGKYSNTSGTGFYYDGYLAEVVYIDGLQLTPSSFGEFDEDSPTIFKPIDVSGLTFGNNGFYLDFEDSANLGNDANGGTDLTESNLAAVDQASDSPTNNFATYNPLQVQIGTANEPIFREGNLHIHGSTTGAIHFHAASTIGVSKGKWYAEFKGGSASNQNGLVGVTYDPAEDARNDDYPGQQSHSYAYFVDGNTYTNDSASSYGDAWTTDIIGVALDLDNHKLYFSKNGTWQDSGDPTSGSTGTGSAYNLTTGKTYFFATGDGNATYVNPFEANFGGGSVSAISSGNSDANGLANFEYSVPSGYYSLCTKNLAEYG